MKSCWHDGRTQVAEVARNAELPVSEQKKNRDEEPDKGPRHIPRPRLREDVDHHRCLFKNAVSWRRLQARRPCRRRSETRGDVTAAVRSTRCS